MLSTVETKHNIGADGMNVLGIGRGERGETFEFLTYFTKTIQSSFPKYGHKIAPNVFQAHAKDRDSR